MPEISISTKIILGLISASAALSAVLVGYVLAASVIAVSRGRQNAAARRPLVLGIVFILSAAISVLAGSIATFAPLTSERPIPVQQAAVLREPAATSLFGSLEAPLDVHESLFLNRP